MSLKGTLRTIQAAQRRAERDAQRRRRELERSQVQLERMQERERAEYEVAVFENLIEVMTSLHKECGPSWNWEDIARSSPPKEPQRQSSREVAARKKLESYKPGTIDKLLRRSEQKQQALEDELQTAIRLDENDYRDSLDEYHRAYTDWKSLVELAEQVINDEPGAHIAAIEAVEPFSEIAGLGSSLTFELKGDLIECNLKTNSESVVPSETKSLLKSGKLSTKSMPKTRYYEIYQDYVCGSAIRVARELFALLPIEMVFVNVLGDVLNTKTGHMEERPILSIFFPRKTMATLNFGFLDPSDSLPNFVHNVSFKKLKGFEPVEPLDANSLNQQD